MPTFSKRTKYALPGCGPSRPLSFRHVRACPGHPRHKRRLDYALDARDKPGHDEDEQVNRRDDSASPCPAATPILYNGVGITHSMIVSCPHCQTRYRVDL